MQTSKNLPLQLISKSLFEQFAPNMEPLADYVQIDYATYAEYAKNSITRYGRASTIAVRETFEAFAKLNRDSPVKAYRAAQQHLAPLSANQPMEAIS